MKLLLFAASLALLVLATPLLTSAQYANSDFEISKASYPSTSAQLFQSFYLAERARRNRLGLNYDGTSGDQSRRYFPQGRFNTRYLYDQTRPDFQFRYLPADAPFWRNGGRFSRYGVNRK